MGGVILKRRRNWKTQLLNDWQIYILLLPGIIYFIIFHYIPLYGIQIAFKDYKVSKGIADSAWIGFENFRTFFNSYYCGRLILNTLLLNVYSLLWSFPVPIILALLLNRIKQERFKKFTQTVIYIPHFISISGGRMSDKCPPFVRGGKSALFSSLAARFRSASVEDCPIISSMSVI